jgi:hypothetical protein
MIRGSRRTQFALPERIANPRREAAPQRLMQSRRRHGPVGVHAPLQHRAPWRDPAFLTQQGDPP